MHAQTLEEVVSPYLHFPTAIQTALLRLETHPSFRPLPRSTVPVLKALVTRVPALNGCGLFRARISRVAEEAAVSDKTVQRVLRACEEMGWLVPGGTCRSSMGEFRSRWYNFTTAFCTLVSLPAKGEGLPAETAVLPQETRLSDGAIYNDLSLKKEYLEISIKNRGETPIRLPAPVETMPAETGIRPTGICKLLGIAARAGHKLEHVYLIAKPYLQRAGAKGSRAFSYLRAMLTSPKQVDYAAKAAQLTRVSDPNRVDLSRIARECRYKRYTHPRQRLHFRIYDGEAEVTDATGRTEHYVGRQMDGIYRGIAAGNLIEVKD